MSGGLIRDDLLKSKRAISVMVVRGSSRLKKSAKPAMMAAAATPPTPPTTPQNKNARRSRHRRPSKLYFCSFSSSALQQTKKMSDALKQHQPPEAVEHLKQALEVRGSSMW